MKIKRRSTLAAILLAIAGCGGGGSGGIVIPKPLEINFQLSTDLKTNTPIKIDIAEANKRFIPQVTVDFDTETDSNRDGKPDNDQDFKDQNKTSYTFSTSYLVPGSYTLRASYKDVDGNTKNVTKTILVKPNNTIFKGLQEKPLGYFYIKKTDFDNFVKNNIDVSDQKFIQNLEQIITANILNGETIDGLGFKQDDIIIGINSPNSRFKDDDNDGIKEYFGTLEGMLDLLAIKNINDLLTKNATDYEMIKKAASLAPRNAGINYDIVIPLLTYGDISSNLQIYYPLNNNQINILIVLDTQTSPALQQDENRINAFNNDYRNQNKYIPLSVLILSDSSLYEVVRKIDAEIKYHADNNK